MEWWRYLGVFGWIPCDPYLSEDDQHAAIPHASIPDDSAYAFTHRERARLCKVRDRASATRARDKRCLDERRLWFARWLVEHERLGEGS